LFCGKYWYWAAIVAAVVNTFAQLATVPYYVVAYALCVLGSIIIGVLSGGLCLTGAGIAKLIKYGFKRKTAENTDVKPKNLRILSAMAGILLPLVLVVSSAYITSTNLWQNLAEYRIKQELNKLYPNSNLHIEEIRKQWNNVINHTIYIIDSQNTEYGNYLYPFNSVWGGLFFEPLDELGAYTTSDRLSAELTALANSAMLNSKLTADVREIRAYYGSFGYAGYGSYYYDKLSKISPIIDKEHFSIDMQLDLNQQEVPLYLEVVVNNSQASTENALQILREVKAVMEKDGINFDDFSIFFSDSENLDGANYYVFNNNSNYYEFTAEELN
jgi:hypothetical protein